MSKSLIKGIMGASLLASVLTGCGQGEENDIEVGHSKVYMPSKYQKEPRFDITSEELIKLSTPFYSELSSTETLASETLSMSQNAREFEKKEAERKHKEELERRRLAKLEEEKKKKQQVQPTISRGEAQPSGNWVAFKGTYYGADCAGCSGKTAYGFDVRNTIYANGLRIIAVDPRIIPLGSIVEVQAPYGTFKAIAGDTGGAIKGNKTDILVGSEAEATQIGTHTVYIRILK